MAISKWEGVEDKLIQIEAWARDGLTNEDICHNLGISIPTLRIYKDKYPSLSLALKMGKEVADILVENALYKRCLGYSYDEVTTERVPVYENGAISGHEMAETKRVKKEVLPDPVSAFFWLKNRKHEEWKDKREVETKIEVRVPMLEEIQDTFKTMRMLNNVEVVDAEIVGGE